MTKNSMKQVYQWLCQWLLKVLYLHRKIKGTCDKKWMFNIIHMENRKHKIMSVNWMKKLANNVLMIGSMVTLFVSCPLCLSTRSLPTILKHCGALGLLLWFLYFILKEVTKRTYHITQIDCSSFYCYNCRCLLIDNAWISWGNRSLCNEVGGLGTLFFAESDKCLGSLKVITCFWKKYKDSCLVYWIS